MSNPVGAKYVDGLAHGLGPIALASMDGHRKIVLARVLKRGCVLRG